MARTLRPGDLPPVPKSNISGMNRATKVSTYSQQIGEFAENFDDAILGATGLSLFEDAYKYAGNIKPGDRSPQPNAAAKRLARELGLDERYYAYLDPGAFTREATKNYYGDVPDDAEAPAQGKWDIPTSSSNYKRPRTLAAGYNRQQKLLTVVFRDGTFWNYYDVPHDEWIKFHAAYSKGPLLNGGNTPGQRAGSSDGPLLSYKHGPADLSQLDEEAKNFFLAAVRSSSIALRKTRVSKARKAAGFSTQGTQSKSAYQRERRANARQLTATAATATKAKNPSNGGKNTATAGRPRR